MDLNFDSVDTKNNQINYIGVNRIGEVQHFSINQEEGVIMDFIDAIITLILHILQSFPL